MVLNWKLEVKWKHWQQASVPVFVPRLIPSRSVYQIPWGSAGVKLLGSTVSFCLSFSDFSPQFCCASLISDFPSNPASLPDYSFLPTTSDWESHKPATTVWLEEGACTRRWREVPCFNCAVFCTSDAATPACVTCSCLPATPLCLQEPQFPTVFPSCCCSAALWPMHAEISITHTVYQCFSTTVSRPPRVPSSVPWTVTQFHLISLKRIKNNIPCGVTVL